MCGINVNTEDEVISLPEGKILKAQLLLPNPLLDAGVTRLPINLIQKLRGKWSFGEVVVAIFVPNVQL